MVGRLPINRCARGPLCCSAVFVVSSDCWSSSEPSRPAPLRRWPRRVAFGAQSERSTERAQPERGRCRHGVGRRRRRRDRLDPLRRHELHRRARDSHGRRRLPRGAAPVRHGLRLNLTISVNSRWRRDRRVAAQQRHARGLVLPRSGLGDFSVPQAIASVPGQTVSDPATAINDAGAAMVVWRLGVTVAGTYTETIYGAYRTPGGSFNTAPISSGDTWNQSPRVVLDPSGKATIVWSYWNGGGSGSANNFARVRVRAPTGRGTQRTSPARRPATRCSRPWVSTAPATRSVWSQWDGTKFNVTGATRSGRRTPGTPPAFGQSAGASYGNEPQVAVDRPATRSPSGVRRTAPSPPRVGRGRVGADPYQPGGDRHRPRCQRTRHRGLAAQRRRRLAHRGGGVTPGGAFGRGQDAVRRDDRRRAGALARRARQRAGRVAHSRQRAMVRVRGLRHVVALDRDRRSGHGHGGPPGPLHRARRSTSGRPSRSPGPSTTGATRRGPAVTPAFGAAAAAAPDGHGDADGGRPGSGDHDAASHRDRDAAEPPAPRSDENRKAPASRARLEGLGRRCRVTKLDACPAPQGPRAWAASAASGPVSRQGRSRASHGSKRRRPARRARSSSRSRPTFHVGEVPAAESPRRATEPDRRLGIVAPGAPDQDRSDEVRAKPGMR